MLEIKKTENQLFRYRKANDYTLDELEKGYIYFASNKELNDPFDASHLTLKLTNQDSEILKLYNQLLEQSPDDITKAYITKQYANDFDKLREFVKEGTKKFISTFGISCFTVSPIHIVLWATYANNHEGICIQYDVTKDKSFFDGARRIDYVNDFDIIDYQPFSNPQVSHNIFYKKLNLWEKEFEVRLVKNNTGKIYFNPECVRSIVLGLRANDEYTRKVLNIVRNKYKHATLYKAELMTNGIGLSFIPYEI